MKLVDETNSYFAHAGVRILRPGNRFNGGKGTRYKVRSEFSGSGGVSFLLPQALPGQASTAAPAPVPTQAPPPAPTPAPPTSTTTVAPSTTTPGTSPCEQFCSLEEDLQRTNEKCSKYNGNEDKCLKSYFHRAAKNGRTVPCTWLGSRSKCKPDKSRQQSCPGLEAMCKLAPTPA